MPGVCSRCSRNVFFAEEKVALGKVWHNLCFSCRNCRKLLDSWTVVTHNGELFCQRCYVSLLTNVKHNWQTGKLKNNPSCHCCHTDVNYEGDSKRSDDSAKAIENFHIDLTDLNDHSSIISIDDQSCRAQRNSTARESPESLITVDRQSRDTSANKRDKSIFNDPSDESTPKDVSTNCPNKMCCVRCRPSSCEASSSTEPLIVRRRVSFQDHEKNPSDYCDVKNSASNDSVDDDEEEIKEFTSDSEVNQYRLRGGSRCHLCSNDENDRISRRSSCSSKHYCSSPRVSHDNNSCRQSNDELHQDDHTTEHFDVSVAIITDDRMVTGAGTTESNRSRGGSCNPSKSFTYHRSSQTPPQNPENFYKSAYCPRCQSAAQEDSGFDIERIRSPVGSDYFGGGLDCQRCGRKVYHAEMQMVSGSPYHNICFSCFCCRKPLETLSYHESRGEIYCKQCYIRHFGPQGYGYAGVLQTPI